MLETETPTDWSRDGRFVLYGRLGEGNSNDIWVLPVEGAKQPLPLLDTAFNETGARFSPDGQWIAYVSDESGSLEIYLRPVTNSAEGRLAVGAKWRVSTNGGTQPHWRGDGKELLYRDRTGAMMSTGVTVQGGTAQTDVPQRLFVPPPNVNGWDVTGDGKRFLFAVPVAQQATSDPITVILNWRTTKDTKN